MSKFVIEPGRVYSVQSGCECFFIRVLERWYSDYKVEIAQYPDPDDFSLSDLKFEPAIYNKFELSRCFGSFVFDAPEAEGEDEEFEEA